MKRRVKPTGKTPKVWAPGPAGGGSAAKPPGGQDTGGRHTLGPAAKRRPRPAPP